MVFWILFALIAAALTGAAIVSKPGTTSTTPCPKGTYYDTGSYIDWGVSCDPGYYKVNRGLLDPLRCVCSAATNQQQCGAGGGTNCPGSITSYVNDIVYAAIFIGIIYAAFKIVPGYKGFGKKKRRRSYV